MSVDSLQKARSHYEKGEFRQCREAALEGLTGTPDDVELLRLAGRAGTELHLDDAFNHLKKAVEIEPDSADGWRDLGEAFASEGRMDEASAAFQRTLELRPDDLAALTQMGHAAYASGREEEAVSYLAKAAEREPGHSTAVISLVEMYRTMGQPAEALTAAKQIAAADPDDVLAAVDIADLSLRLGLLDEALAAFKRLREIEDELEHDVYALHGMIQVEIRRGDWRKALDLAVETTTIDHYGRTKDLLAFLVSKVFGPGDQPAPTEADIDAAFAASQAEHRLLHSEDSVFEEGPYL